MMKKISCILCLFFIISISIFSEEWVSDKGQKLIFINQTAIKFKENSLADIGPKIRCWKNAIMSLSINTEGNALCDIIVSPDDYNIVESTEWISWLYSWFYSHIEDEKQRNAFMSIGFIVRYRNEFSRGAIEQYAALRRSGYVKFYDDTHFEAGGYTADCTDYSYFYPKYNEVTQSWNSGYIYRYIIGDFEIIKDMPVPPGLDDSFKKDFERIPQVIEQKDWKTFNSFVSKYDLKLNNYFTTLLENEAPVSVYQSFSESQIQKYDYKNAIPDICKNIKLLIFFYNYFSKSELELVTDYFKKNPDVYVDFCKTANMEFSTLEPSLPEYFVLKCSVDNVEYITRSYDISLVTPVLSKIENERIEKILKNRNDEVSNFLKLYYLDFNSVSIDKLINYSDKLNLTISDLLINNVYDITKPVLEKLIENESYSNVVESLFEKDFVKLIIINSNEVYITTDFNNPGISIPNYKASDLITKILQDPIFDISYKVYSGEITLDELFSSDSLIVNNCKFKLTFDSGEDYSSSKKKTGTFLFGEIKNGKLSKKNIKIINSKNETLLFISIRNGNDVLSQQLIKEGIDTSIQNIEGKTALNIAIDTGNTKIQKILRKK